MVAAKIILPESSLITPAATAKESLTATSKLPFKLPARGGSQKEGKPASSQAER